MKRLILFLTLATLTTLTLFSTARAGGPVFPVVTNCTNDTELQSKVAEMESGQGGTLTFNCGTATIAVTTQLPTISRNTTIDGGGKITLNGNAAVRFFSVNNTGILTLKNIVLKNGYGGSGDGGAISSTGQLTLDHVTIDHGSSPFNGGAVYTTGLVHITNSTLSNNIASRGGAIYASGVNTQLTITNSTLNDNSADTDKLAGAIYVEGPLTVTGTTFTHNLAGSAGAIYARKVVAATSATISNSTFQGNQATGSYPNANGGALYVENETATVQFGTFQNNHAQSGGAIFVLTDGRLNLSESTLSDNSSINGGGIYNKGTATLTNDTLARNSGSHGGGIHNLATLTLTNVTLSGNSASYGGGLKNEGGTTTLVNDTFSNNSATGVQGGGVLNTGSSPHLNIKNSIVANSTTGGNCAFQIAVTTSSFNLSSDGTCGFGAGRDNINPLLGPLADNGGSAQSHLPQVGSPAIDSGTDSGAPSIDQRGIPRPELNGFDVGSVEFTCAKPAAPTLLKPKDGRRGKGPAVALDWSDAMCAASYKVTIKHGSSSGSLVQKKGGLTTSTFTTQPLTIGQTYAWQVKACNPPYGCAKSPWQTFKVK
jgi:Chlamydia polymorphic membrane protein (Chlamydia_PMP) repeat